MIRFINIRSVLIVLAIMLSLLGATKNVSAQEYKILRDTTQQEVVTIDEVKEDKSGNIKLHFRINSYFFEPDFSNNAYELQRIDSIMQNEDLLFGLDSVVIRATASLDGLETNNATLAANRAKTVKRILSTRYEDIDSAMIRTHSIAEDWNEFREMVVADLKIPYRAEVLRIIDDNRRTLDAKEWLLRTMYKRATWNYLAKNIFPRLRYGASVVLYYNINKIESRRLEDVVTIDSVLIEEPVKVSPPAIAPRIVEFKKKPLFAIKTNLLYDAVSVLNIELEVPIGERWSVAGEWTFPWWDIDNSQSNSKRIFLQTVNGTLETKYWLGDRTKRDVLTGWFLGLYGGGGKYDFENKYEGYQGEFWHAGISGGYAHKLNKKGSLRMEYALGLGYMYSDYRYYEDHFGHDGLWHPIRQSIGKFNWVGPTRLEVSLVWFLGYRTIKKTR